MSLFVSQRVRRRLEMAPGATGKVALESARAARELMQRLEAARHGAAGLSALSLLEEAVARLLEPGRRRGLLERAAQAAERELGRERLALLLAEFAAEFGIAPPPAAPEGAVEDAAAGGEAVAAPAARADHQIGLVRELLIFWWLRSNPALGPLYGLLDQSRLAASAELAAAGRAFRRALAEEPGIEAGGGSLLAALEEPLRAAPDSPIEQLRWLLARWRSVVADLETRIAASLDLAAEEDARRFPPGAGAAGPGPARAAGAEADAQPRPAPGAAEALAWQAVGGEARYSPDRDWMPGTVLIAKNALVWLEQLARRYDRPVRRLDEIPEEALAKLVARGFNALWLIGLWERSPASRRIKQLSGNVDAEASAYSVRGYRIARRLGGDAALEGLRRKADRHGLRLAADMVPNHAGIDSEWVIEHPERFISEPQCPFPSYTFTGPDLTPAAPVAIHIEDHYFDRSDAAVVFRRTDRATGEVRYLYHGNDGTSMPWNDTAQLDYLRADTREAVMEQIVEVARRFPVIRFDAAMILTRHHFRRLWYPGPGEEEAIPSRAQRALARADFDARMPREFWRELVDRLAVEAPDTLLIAEAFWLLEGFFVRVLGMHRVYNSAFMNMLGDGDAAGYRELMREMVAFDPAMLERLVNFMSNPDEKTAAEQFGTGDRYRAVCLLMATLPGTPMFAHGQVEGFREHYGMEYQRSYHDEEPDPELVAWHEQTLAPVLARRELFAGSEHFELFDLRRGGELCESALAFANGTPGERVLVVFNASPRPVRGRIHRSVPRAESGGALAGDRRRPSLASVPLTGALALDPARQVHRLRDLLAGTEIEVDTRRLVERGLELELGPWEFRLLASGAGLAADRPARRQPPEAGAGSSSSTTSA